MRSNRRKNWFIKRIALGLAVAAIAAPVAQAKIDEGSSVQARTESSIVQAHTYQPVQANGYQAFVTDFPSVPSGQFAKGIVNSDYPSLKPTVVASAYGMPRATPQDYAISRGDLIEVVRSTPSGTSSDKIEFVRTQPRSIGEPQVVAAGFDWKDAGVGAGLALALVLLGGGAALASRHVGRAQTAS
jgi:hypothetical protein